MEDTAFVQSVSFPKAGAESVVVPARGLTALHLCPLVREDFRYTDGHLLERNGLGLGDKSGNYRGVY